MQLWLAGLRAAAVLAGAPAGAVGQRALYPSISLFRMRALSAAAFYIFHIMHFSSASFLANGDAIALRDTFVQPGSCCSVSFLWPVPVNFLWGFFLLWVFPADGNFVVPPPFTDLKSCYVYPSVPIMQKVIHP